VSRGRQAGEQWRESREPSGAARLTEARAWGAAPPTPGRYSRRRAHTERGRRPARCGQRQGRARPARRVRRARHGRAQGACAQTSVGAQGGGWLGGSSDGARAALAGGRQAAASRGP
jgi:hypothetical protein